MGFVLTLPDCSLRVQRIGPISDTQYTTPDDGCSADDASCYMTGISACPTGYICVTGAAIPNIQWASNVDCSATYTVVEDTPNATLSPGGVFEALTTTGVTIEYAFSAGLEYSDLFTVSQTGIVTVGTGGIDYDTRTVHSFPLTVVASLQSGGAYSGSVQCSFTVTIGNTNENPTQPTDQGGFSVEEKSMANVEVGYALPCVMARPLVVPRADDPVLHSSRHPRSTNTQVH